MVAGSQGFTQRGSTTVTVMPWAFSRPATSRQSSLIAPTETISTSRSSPAPSLARTSTPSCRRAVATISAPTLPLEVA